MTIDHCLLKFPHVENPLGEPCLPTLPLAPRLSSLKGKIVVIINNGKMALGKTSIFTDLLIKELQSAGVKEIRNERLPPAPEEYADLASMIPKTIKQISTPGPFDAAILGLGDSGSFAVRITFLALELEKMGIPTVGIYTEPLAPTAATIAFASCPDLPIVTVKHPTWCASREEVEETAAAALPHLISALTRLNRHTKAIIGAKRFVRGRTFPTPHQEMRALGHRAPSRPLTVEIDPGDWVYDIYEKFCENKLCDGFPVLPPTTKRVQAMLDGTDRAPDHVIAPSVVPSMAPITVEKLAINAVMAGCKPEYFPVIITAFEAMAEAPFNLSQGNTTFAMVAPGVIVSGPIADEIEMNAGKGLLSPGCRANSTIGRAIFLSLNNICGSVPGQTDNSGIGCQGKYSYCFAEQREKNPWKPLNEEYFDSTTTTVTALFMYTPYSVMDHASETAADLMTTFANVAGAIDRPVNQPVASYPTSRVVIFSPDHVKILEREGWTKNDIRYFLFEHARNKLRRDQYTSIWNKSGMPRGWPKWMYHTYDERIPAIRSPEDIIIVVAGELGPHSAICFPWGPSRPVTKAIALSNGDHVNSVKQISSQRSLKAQRITNPVK